MTESEFWLLLEHRLCGEFAGMRYKHLRRLWCDGFQPSWYRLDDPVPRISGISWIGVAPEQEEWKFTLFLEHPVASPSEIDWASLLPPDNVTRWLAVDVTRRSIEIEPAASVPDLKVD